MGHYGAKTPKRHIAWSNSRAVGRLCLGPLRGWDYQSDEYKKNRTAKKTISKEGKKQFAGNRKQLKDSQFL